MFNKKIVINIDGMSCTHCASSVENALKTLDNVKKVKVNLKKNNATITYKNDIDLDTIKARIEDLGYSYVGVSEA